MATNITNGSAFAVLDILTDLPRLKEVLWGIVSFYKNYFKNKDKILLQRAPERKETGDSETSLEGRGPSETYADGTASLTRTERREEKKKNNNKEESKRKAEESERKAKERERKAKEREHKAAEKNGRR